jgi:broad specificity phosphatase PhoE
MHPWCSLPDRVAVVLVRHGRTAYNAERRFLGITDVPLDEVGREEVDRLAAQVRGSFEAIYCSPLLRARQTAAPLAPPEAIVEPDLRELHLGELEGLSGSEAMERHAPFLAAFREGDPTDLRVPGGETFGELLLRSRAAIERIARRHVPGERVAVVTHQMVIAALTCTLRGDPLASWRRYGVANAEVSMLTWDGQGLRVADSGGSSGEP